MQQLKCFFFRSLKRKMTHELGEEKGKEFSVRVLIWFPPIFSSLSFSLSLLKVALCQWNSQPPAMDTMTDTYPAAVHRNGTAHQESPATAAVAALRLHFYRSSQDMTGDGFLSFPPGDYVAEELCIDAAKACSKWPLPSHPFRVRVLAVAFCAAREIRLSADPSETDQPKSVAKLCNCPHRLWRTSSNMVDLFAVSPLEIKKNEKENIKKNQHSRTAMREFRTRPTCMPSEWFMCLMINKRVTFQEDLRWPSAHLCWQMKQRARRDQHADRGSSPPRCATCITSKPQNIILWFVFLSFPSDISPLYCNLFGLFRERDRLWFSPSHTFQLDDSASEDVFFKIR